MPEPDVPPFLWWGATAGAAVLAWVAAAAIDLDPAAPAFAAAAGGLAGLAAHRRDDARYAYAAAAMLAAAGPLALFAVPDAAALGTVLASVAAGAGGAATAWLLARGRPWLGDAPATNAIAAAVLAGYLSFRDVVAQGIGHAELWEWTVGVALLALAASRVKAVLRRGMTEEPWTSPARRHEAEVAPRLDARHEAWARATRDFVEAGVRRADYEALWRAAFATVARRGETVEKALEPLAMHEDAARPWWPWRVRRVQEDDRRRRLQVHRTLLARLRAARRVRAKRGPA